MTAQDTLTPEGSTISPDILDRRTSNAESLVGRLNFDVLGNIFMQITIVDFRSPHSPSQTLRRASHVCHAWRECALGHIALWGASLDFGDPIRWIEECIRRSGTSPLYDIILPSLTAQLMSPAQDEFMSTSAKRPRQTHAEIIHSRSATNIEIPNLLLGMSVVRRARNVYIKIRKPRWDIVNDALMVTAPNIRTLAVCVQGSQQTDDVYDLQHDLFAGHAPNLRELELRGCNCTFLSPVLWNLTTLIVKRPSSRNTPTLTNWLEILAKLKRLRVLELSHCTAPVDPEEDLAGWPSVSLPDLQEFTLTGYLPVCSFLTTHLSIPDTCSVDVNCYRTARDIALALMVAAIHDRIQRVHVPPSSGRTVLSLNASSTGLGFEKRFLDEPRKEETLYSYKWFASPRQLPNIVAIIPDILPTLTIAALDVPELRLDFNNSHGLTEHHTRSLLSVFENVDHLQLSMPYTVWHVMATMRDGAEEDSEGSDTDGAALLSKLESISLEHVLFQDDTPRMPKADDLIQFVFDRPKIKKVSLVNCTPVEYIAEELELFGITCTTTGAGAAKPIHPDPTPEFTDLIRQYAEIPQISSAS